LIFPDQWRGDCLSSQGHPVVRTPHVDTLAYEGVTFTHAYSPAPTCIASRACLATGQTASTCGRLGYQDGVPWTYDQTLMHCLADAGYQTINVGKTHFFPQEEKLGFEISRLYDPQRHTPGFLSEYHRWLAEKTGGCIRDTAHDFSNNTWVPLPWTYDDYLHPTNWTADTAIEELERRDTERPVFLQIGFHRPHPPYDPPWTYYARYQHRELPPVPVGDWARAHAGNPVDAWAGTRGELSPEVQDDSRRAYYAAINHIDDQIGKIMFWLRRSKLYEDTWIIFTSDHGEMLGNHHMRHKIVPLEGSARIPLVVKPPASSGCQTGVTCDAPVTLTDLMPTLLEEAGVEIPDKVEAPSLSPLLRGSKTLPGRAWIHGEHAPCWQYMTDGREKYIWNSVTGVEQFFDLQNDPQELHDLAGEGKQPECLATWRQRLVAHLATPERIGDGLSDGKRLLSGVALPSVRPGLLEAMREQD
jgi:arylsulfatase A-like enzyme